MKRQDSRQTLLIGTGNPAREDDGAGWRFVEQVEREGWFVGDVVYRFQINLEDVELMAHYRQVIFADACRNELPSGFSVCPCIASGERPFSSHLLSPSYSLYLCKTLFSHHPDAWVVAIQGYRWELKEGISAICHENISRAFAFFRKCRDTTMLSC